MVETFMAKLARESLRFERLRPCGPELRRGDSSRGITECARSPVGHTAEAVAMRPSTGRTGEGRNIADASKGVESRSGSRQYQHEQISYDVLVRL